MRTDRPQDTRTVSWFVGHDTAAGTSLAPSPAHTPPILTVGLLVGGALPRRARLTEVHLRAGGVFDVLPAGHLASLVPGQGLDHVSGLAAEGASHGVSGPVGVVAVGKGHCEGLAAQPLHEGRDRGAVAGADDQVALPVAGLAAVTRGGGALADGPEIAQRAGLCCAAPSGLSASAAPRQAAPGALGQPAGAAVVIGGPVDRLR